MSADTTKAIADLRAMQSQIIHGKNTFGEIADLIDRLERELAEARRESEEFQRRIADAIRVNADLRADRDHHQQRAERWKECAAMLKETASKGHGHGYLCHCIYCEQMRLNIAAFDRLAAEEGKEQAK